MWEVGLCVLGGDNAPGGCYGKEQRGVALDDYVLWSQGPKAILLVTKVCSEG